VRCLEAASTVTDHERSRCELLVTRIELARDNLRPRGRCMQTASKSKPVVTHHTYNLLWGSNDNVAGRITSIAADLYKDARFRMLHYRIILVGGQAGQVVPRRKKIKTLNMKNTMTRVECIQAYVWDRDERTDRCRAVCVVMLKSPVFNRDMRVLLARVVWAERENEEWQSWDYKQGKWRE